MIGHFLLTLKPEEEDRVLTRPMQAEGFAKRGFAKHGSSVGCLVEVALDCTDIYMDDELLAINVSGDWVPTRYDELCERFGEARINAAIRNRILANRAARTLRAQEVCL